VTERHYTGAGLTIAADRQIPGLRGPGPRASVDLTIHTAQAPVLTAGPYVLVHSGGDDGSGAPLVVLSRSRHAYRFEYADGTRFWVDAAAEHVWMTWRTTFEDACTYLIGPIMAFVLRRRGDVALHASAVQIGGSAVALVGPHGSGKSTAAAALARAGCAVITDDLLRLTSDGGGWLAHPYGSALRLWPASAALLYGDAEQLPRITASWDKRGLALAAGNDAVPAPAPVPLRTVIFLSRSSSAEAGCESRPVTGSDTILRLIANSSASHLLDLPARADEFRAVTRLARAVASFAVTVGHGADALDRLVRYLLA
jgi:hypothetical protein